MFTEFFPISLEGFRRNEFQSLILKCQLTAMITGSLKYKELLSI